MAGPLHRDQRDFGQTPAKQCLARWGDSHSYYLPFVNSRIVTVDFRLPAAHFGLRLANFQAGRAWRTSCTPFFRFAPCDKFTFVFDEKNLSVHTDALSIDATHSQAVLSQDFAIAGGAASCALSCDRQGVEGSVHAHAALPGSKAKVDLWTSMGAHLQRQALSVDFGRRAVGAVWTLRRGSLGRPLGFAFSWEKKRLRWSLSVLGFRHEQKRLVVVSAHVDWPSKSQVGVVLEFVEDGFDEKSLCFAERPINDALECGIGFYSRKTPILSQKVVVLRAAWNPVPGTRVSGLLGFDLEHKKMKCAFKAGFEIDHSSIAAFS
jgi:hypothetical protein